MKFEQAFYTRGTDLLNQKKEGLGISAASKIDYEFLNKCMSVGSKFNTEDSKELAEFVLYSDRFQAFVGVGVSRAYNMDGGARNKLCHMYIPMESSDTADAYYLDYVFRTEVEKREELDVVEFFPCLCADDFSRILEKYEFDQEKLAYFLYKLYPILFGEKNLLLMVLDETIYDKSLFFEMGRELTWLASYLVPGFEKEARKYRERLSYSVNSTNNFKIVNLAFTSDETLYENRFFMGKTSDEEIPQVYYALAERALQSYADFTGFLQELEACKLEKYLDSRTLQLHYINWKVNHQISITWNEVPLNGFALRQNINNAVYRKFLFRCIHVLEDASESELKKIWIYIIKPCFDEKFKQEQENVVLAVSKIIDMAYQNQFHYKIFFQDIPKHYQQVILEKIYDETSYIQDDIANISNKKECKEVFTLYEGLCNNQSFFYAMQDKILSYYFEMDLEERSYFSEKFATCKEQWDASVLDKITVIFQGKLENVCDFIEREIGKIEKCYILDYFQLLLERSEEDAQIYDTADTYLKTYQNEIAEVSEEILIKYDDRKTAWECNAVRKELEKDTLEKLSRRDICNVKIALKEVWLDVTTSCLEQRLQQMQYWESSKDEILENLLEQWEDLENVDAEKLDKYETAIWCLCKKDDILSKLICSITFGLQKFSIWNEIVMNDAILDVFETIYHAIGTSYHNYVKVEKEALFEKSQKDTEFIRICYNIWKAFVKSKDCEFQMWENCEWVKIEPFAMRARIFLDILKKCDGITDGIIFLRLEMEKEELSGKTTTIVERCKEYDDMEAKNPTRFVLLFDDLKDSKTKDEMLENRIYEIRTYYQVGNYVKMADTITKEDLDSIENVLEDAKHYLKTTIYKNEKVNSLDKIYREKKEMEALKEKVKALEETLKEKNDEIANLNEKNQELQMQNNKLEREKKSAEPEIKRLQKNEQQLQKQVENLNQENQKLKKVKKDLEYQLGTVNSDLAQKGEINRLTRENTKLNKEVQELKKTVSNLQMNLKNSVDNENNTNNNKPVNLKEYYMKSLT